MSKKNTENLRSIMAYLNAIKNEIEIDTLRYKSLRLDPSEYGYLPRPSKWISTLKPYRKLLGCASYLWQFFFYYIFILVNYLKLLYMFFGRDKQVILPEETYTIAIAFSSRSIDVINTSLSDELKFTWLLPYWVESSQIKKTVPVHDLLSLLNFKDINQILYLTILASHCYSRKMNSVWNLQLYTSFKWFLVYIALSKINCNFVISEHFDRFAVLIDSIAQNKNNKITMIQHGLIGNTTDPDDILYKLNLPTRLNCVSKLYAYDTNSEYFFRNNVFAHSHNNIDVSYFTPKLTVTNIGFRDVPKILFVGHTGCEELHSFILRSLKMKINIKAYYKPHPTENIHLNFLKKQNWIIINERDFFPSVDLLVSYPSTLTKEYESVGIKSIIHPINLEPENAIHYLNLIEEELKTINLKRNNDI
jgi:hypothetical protein